MSFLMFASSICVFLPSCMSGLPSQHKHGERINTLAHEATLLESDGLSALHRSDWPSDGGAARLLPRFKITTISGRG